MTLDIAPKLSLPDDFVTQSAAILARRGAGKTYTASVLTEELIGAGLPVVALDPLGVWFGLRSSADGTKAGLPMTILGGEHGDVPLEPTGGKVIAELVTDEPGGYIVDMSLFESQAAQDRFACDFAERLYRAKRRDSAPLHLMVDEAHNFVPQNPGTGRGAGGIGPKLLGAFEVLIRQGRSRGLGCTLISQRPAVVNKNVLSQAEVLIAGQVTGVKDRDALTDWAEGWATKEQLTEFKGSLASLRVGEVWVWSPQWLGRFERVTIRKRRTFDSSATPKVGEVRVEPRVLAPVDLEVVKECLAATIEKADASDPKKLTARIRDLERELRQAPTPEPVVERVEVPVVDPVVVGLLRDGLAEIDTHLETLQNIEGHVRTLLASLATAAPAPKRHGWMRQGDGWPPAVRDKASRHDTTIGGTEKKVLAVLIQFPEGKTKDELAAFAGYSKKASTVGVALSKLRAAGYVTSDGIPRATEEGFAALPDVPPMPTGPELLDYWRAKLGGTERKVLDVILEMGNPTKDEIADAADYSRTASTVGVALSKLRGFGLVEGTALSLAFADAIA